MPTTCLSDHDGTLGPALPDSSKSPTVSCPNSRASTGATMSRPARGRARRSVEPVIGNPSFVGAASIRIPTNRIPTEHASYQGRPGWKSAISRCDFSVPCFLTPGAARHKGGMGLPDLGRPHQSAPTGVRRGRSYAVRPEAALEPPDEPLKLRHPLVQGGVSARSRATSAADSRTRVCRQRAMRHRGEQTHCGFVARADGPERGGGRHGSHGTRHRPGVRSPARPRATRPRTCPSKPDGAPGR